MVSCSWRTALACAAMALATTISGQSIVPSNDSSAIPSYESYPRFWVNGTDFDNFRVVPLGWYGRISQQIFLGIQVNGKLVNVDENNVRSVVADAIDYVSCDPEDYPGVLGAVDVLRMVSSNQPASSVILYSTRTSHCETSNLGALSPANGIFTTIDPVVAALVESSLGNDTNGRATSITADANSYTGSSSGGGNGYNSNRPGPTTAVAMIILYTITGLITALFVIIIVTGAIRAHRHPERYGPRNVAGRPRRSRAKGIARAMLDTIPIVKFGEKDETPKKAVDIEMSAPAPGSSQEQSKSAINEEKAPEDQSIASGAVAGASTTNADGSDETGQLGCSICTEDFNKGEEVRVLPCNHKFHPECVDPWLLNVSGTCPLCRIDLRPKGEQQATSPTDDDSSLPAFNSTVYQIRRRSAADIMAPPLGNVPVRQDRDQDRGTATFASLRSVAGASREDRIAALRRFRQQRRGRSEQAESAEQEEEQRGLSTRLRERFRIRTRRQGEEEATESAASSSNRPHRISHSNALRNPHAN